MNPYSDIMNKAEEFVTDLYKNTKQHNIIYHTLEHTQNVVTHVFEIASHYELSEKDLAIIDIAAWFHDTGHLFTSPALHEQKSVEIAKEFLNKHHAENAVTDGVVNCILATKTNTAPSGLLQEILKDADTYHFGTKEFKKTNKLVKKESELRGLGTIVRNWSVNTYNMLKEHKFYTNYCLEILNDGKKKNIEWAAKKADGKNNISTSNNLIIDDQPGVKNKDKAKQSSFITKGIQTSLRLSSENHLRLSDMADGKANILISVNAIIISVILSVLLRKIEVDSYLTIPTFIFLAFSVATIIVAIIATRPKVTTGDFSRDDVLNKRTNLLFFGNFYNSSLEEYTWAMSTMMNDSDYVYSTIVQDIYHLGVVLGKKYKLLRIAYNLFMIGIIISVSAFTLSIILHNPENSKVINSTGGSPF